MPRTTERGALPIWSAHTLVVTPLKGHDHFNGHCTCDRWSYRTDDWTDLGVKWAWHYVAESGGPDGHPPARERETAVEYDRGDDCERVACRICGNCLDCDEPGCPGHADCICPLGQTIPVAVAA